MKNVLIISLLSCTVCLACTTTNQIESKPKPVEEEPILALDGEYTLVVEGFDWGAAASKVILSTPSGLAEAKAEDFEVVVERSTNCMELKPEEAIGKLKVLYTYTSDESGRRISSGNFTTLVLYSAPFESLNSPIKYFFGNPNCSGNQWIDFDLTITSQKHKQVWNKEVNRIIPMVDEFDLTGKFNHGDVNLTYAHFKPKSTQGKRPLIIWLHGGGEGGTDTSIPLLANRATNYASPEIQAFFDGAFVLVPQSPTFWMDNGQRQYTRGEVNDMYNESLMALIEDYASNNANIDKDRIYVGGCSNGGYMSLKLLLLHPDYFAAAFPSALAYHSKNLTDEDVNRIKDIPIWFIHSADDPVTKADETVLPVYKKLIDGGAENVHLSYFDHVVDITNQFGGEDYHYNGHFSWIYSHTNKCQYDYDGKPVKLNGKPVSLMGWLASQQRSSR